MQVRKFSGGQNKTKKSIPGRSQCCVFVITAKPDGAQWMDQFYKGDSVRKVYEGNSAKAAEKWTSTQKARKTQCN